MTKIKKPTIRETDVFERTDAIIVELHAHHMRVRLKGHREAFLVDYGALLDLGRRLAMRPWRKIG